MLVVAYRAGCPLAWLGRWHIGAITRARAPASASTAAAGGGRIAVLVWIDSLRSRPISVPRSVLGTSSIGVIWPPIIESLGPSPVGVFRMYPV